MENNEIKSYESSLLLKYHKAKVSHIIILRDGSYYHAPLIKK